MSKLETNTIDTISGSTNLTLGGTNATDITIPSGVTLTNNGAQAGLTLSDNILFNTANKGIYLGVTTATASNLLDDYEEGTFTPTITSGVTSPTYLVQAGTYTKIGQMVYYQLDLRVTGGTLSATDFIIGGLPFNQKDATDGGAFFKYTVDVTTETGKNLPTISNSNNNNILNFYGVDGNRWYGTDMLNNTFIIILNGFYEV